MNLHLVRLRSRARSAGRSIAAPHPREARVGAARVADALGAPLQTRLTLGAPDDAHEREADAVAERVMRMPDGAAPVAVSGEAVQRKCSGCEEEEEVQRQSTGEEEEEEVQRRSTGEEEEEEVQRRSTGEEEEEEVQRQPEDEEQEEEAIQAKADAGSGARPVAADTAARIASLRGRGQPLPASERGFFGPRLGADLSQVRVHHDSDAARLNRRLGARAFTVGGDVFFAQGHYRPGTAAGRELLAHELTHVMQQGHADTIRRWDVGKAPAPHGWTVVSDADHLKRLDEAEGLVKAAIGNRNCKNFFKDNCTDGSGDDAAKKTFDKAQVYLRNSDDNVFGEGEFGGDNLAFNLRAFRIGRYMMASSLLHEMFHNCDATGAGTGRAAELSAENATESCRLHTPWIDTIAPRSAAVGAQVTIRGWNFGPVRGGSDSVEIGGKSASIVKWEFMAGTSSRTEIIVEVPADAGSGLVVINNKVRSNRGRFRVA